MFINVKEPNYECSKCGANGDAIINRFGQNGHYFDYWKECSKCGHNNKPDRTKENAIYTSSPKKVFKF